MPKQTQLRLDERSANDRYKSIDTYKKALENGTEEPDSIITKTLSFEIKTVGEEDERVVRFIASDNSVDRDGDTINVKGWDLKHFRQKGLFLWAHNGIIPPLGKAIKVFIDDDKLKIDIKFIDPDFADHDHVKYADMIYKMYKQKILKDVSVGFRPIKAALAEDRQDDFCYPLNFQKQELLELSAVNIGSNMNVGVESIKSASVDSKITSDPDTDEPEDEPIIQSTYTELEDKIKALELKIATLEKHVKDSIAETIKMIKSERKEKQDAQVIEPEQPAINKDDLYKIINAAIEQARIDQLNGSTD